MTKKIVFILIVLVLGGALGVVAITAQENTMHVNQTLSGTFISIGEGKGIFDVNLKGSPGAANGRGLSFTSAPMEKGDLPAGNICDDLPKSPDGMRITTEGQLNITFNDGSMLFANAAEGGYLCFVPSRVFAPYDVAGGTGRFEGATGYWNADITTHPFGGPTAAVVGESGTVTGEITLP